MKQFMMTIDDDEWERKNALGPNVTHKKIYDLGLVEAERQAEKEKSKAKK